jgi:hypothetical protein
MSIQNPERGSEIPTPQKLTSDEIINLKLTLLQDRELLEDVSAEFTKGWIKNKFPSWDELSSEQQLEFSIYYATTSVVLLTERIALPEAEWAEGFGSPEEYAQCIPLLVALKKSREVPAEIISLSQEKRPPEWQEWIAGNAPSPLLSEDEIKLLRDNGYSGLAR